MRDRKIFRKLAWLAAALGIIAAPAALLSWTESDDVDPHNHSLNALTSTLLITKGGTGAITAEAARESLGVVLGEGVQEWDEDLDLLSKFSDLSSADGAFIVGDGDSLTSESGATARASMGVTIGSDVQAYDADLDVLSAFTSISSADGAVPIGDGTGMTSETGATFRTSVGVAIGSDVQAYDSDLDVFAAFSSISTADGKFIVGDGSAFVVEDGATARTSLGLAIGTNVQAYDADLDALSVFSSLSTADGEIVIGDGSGFTSESGSTARTSLGLAIGSDVQAWDADLDVLAAFSSLSSADGEFVVGNGSALTSESGATARASLGLTIGTHVQAYDSDLGVLSSFTSISTADGKFVVGSGTDFVSESGATARTSLGLAIGTDVQAYDSDLGVLATFTSISTADGKFVVGDGSGYVSESGATARTSLGLGAAALLGTPLTVSSGGTSATTASGARTALGLGSMATQDHTSVNIDGGTIDGITALAVLYGGTGATTASAARAALGLIIGTHVQAYDADLAALSVFSSLSSADGKIVIGDGEGFTSESGATARTSLGVAIGSDVQAYDADLAILSTFTAMTTADGDFIVGDGSGFTTESSSTARASLGLGTIATQGADAVAITGGTLVGLGDMAIGAASATYELDVVDEADAQIGIKGGTGNSAAVYFGDADDADIGKIQYYNSDNSMRFGTNTAEGMRIKSDQTIVFSEAVSANGTITASGGGALTGTWTDLGTVTTIDIDGGTITGITDLAVADGGTGASDASTARTNLGVAVGSDVQAWDDDLDDLAGLAVTDGNFAVGDGSDWTVESGATARTSMGVAIGSDVQAYDADLDALSVFSSLSSADGAVVIGDGEGFTSETGATIRTSLGLAIDTDVQAYDAELDTIAGLSPDENQVLKWVGGVWTAGGVSGDLSAADNETITGDWEFQGVTNFSGGTTVSTLTVTGALAAQSTSIFSGGASFSDHIQVADGKVIGLDPGGPAAGRIQFDDQSVDEVNILSAFSGFGTSNPQTRVHISNGTTGQGSVHAQVALLVEDDANAYIDIRTPNDGTGQFNFSDPDATQPAYINYNHITGLMYFATESDFSFGGGNVGIGLADPGDPLQVLTDSGGEAIAIEENSGDEQWEIGVDSDGDLNFQNDGTIVAEFSDAAGSAFKVTTNKTGYLVHFWNDYDSADRYGLEITAGKDDASGDTYYINCEDGNGDQVGYIWNTSGTFQLVDGSDRRMKKNIRDTEIGGLDIIEGLRVRDFEEGGSTVTQTSFVAQEIAQIYAKAAAGDSTAVDAEGNPQMMGVAKAELVAPLVKAVQELIIKNAAQDILIQDLRDRVEALERSAR